MCFHLSLFPAVCSAAFRSSLFTALPSDWSVLLKIVFGWSSSSSLPHRLGGLVVTASASRAEGPGFESCLHRDFFGVKSYQ